MRCTIHPALQVLRRDQSMSRQNRRDVGIERSSGAAADAAMDGYACGEADAFPELYDLLAPRLYGYLLRQMRCSARSEHLVQQTMLQIHCARGRFIRGASVTPWHLRLQADCSFGDDRLLDGQEAPRRVTLRRTIAPS